MPFLSVCSSSSWGTDGRIACKGKGEETSTRRKENWAERACRELILCEIQGPATWNIDETAELVCVGHYCPKDIKITWIKLHKGKETEIEARTSPTQDNMQPLLSRNRYRAESRKAGERDGSLTLTSTLFIMPSLEEDEGAVFKCRFFTSDHKIKKEKEFKDFKLYRKPEVCGTITCFPCDGINVQCALDLKQFYPKEIQIKWSRGSGKLEVAPSKESETENADRRTFNVRTECIIPEEAFNEVNFRIRVTWKHASLKTPEYREMSATDPDFSGHPRLESILVPPLLHGFEASLHCKVTEYFPKQLQAAWLKVEERSGRHFPQYGGNENVPQSDGGYVPVPPTDANDLSCGKQEYTNITHEPGKGHSCTARLTFTPDLRRDQGSEFICRVSHSSLKEALEKSTGKLIVLSEPKVNKPKIDSSSRDEVRTLSLDVHSFYPGKLTVQWTFDTQGEQTVLPSALNMTEEGGGTYSAQSTCQFSKEERKKIKKNHHPITVTIEHEALSEPLKVTMNLTTKGQAVTIVSQNFSWAPKTPLPSTVK